jgi:hypothetical protein
MRVSRFCSGILLVGFLLPSCEREDLSVESAPERAFTLKREWDRQNAPTNIGLYNNDYVAHFYSLAPSGRLKINPWTGHYWPSQQGGVTYRWSWDQAPNDRARFMYPIMSPEEVFSQRDLSYLSPTEKYEIYNGDYTFPITQAEREETGVMTRTNIPRWFGKCHAWAAAAYSFESPGSFVTKSKDGLKLSFGASDIQGLLALFLHHFKTYTYFVSHRCSIDEKEIRDKLYSGIITREQFDAIMDSAECRGINPGSMHIILANLIHLRNLPFVADVDRFAAVWNQPIYAYDSIVLETRTSNFKAPYAPGTKKAVLVETQMFYTREIGHMWDRVATPNQYSEGIKNYRYWLELDQNDNIIGGLWETEERPDFFWRQDIPEFTGIWKPLETLYKLSIADLKPGSPTKPLDPETPPARYYDTPVSWNIDIGSIFYYIRHVGVSVSPEVKRVVLEVVLLGGEILRYFELRPSETAPNYYQVFDHSLAKIQLLGGKLRLRGMDARGRELFQVSSTSSDWHPER